MQNFLALGGLCPQTPGLRRLGAPPPDPQTAPPQLRISGYAPGSTLTFLKSGVSVFTFTFSRSSLNESLDFLCCVPLALSPSKFHFLI